MITEARHYKAERASEERGTWSSHKIKIMLCLCPATLQRSCSLHASAPSATIAADWSSTTHVRIIW